MLFELRVITHKLNVKFMYSGATLFAHGVSK